MTGAARVSLEHSDQHSQRVSSFAHGPNLCFPQVMGRSATDHKRDFVQQAPNVKSLYEHVVISFLFFSEHITFIALPKCSSRVQRPARGAKRPEIGTRNFSRTLDLLSR